jgi:hypothetical protein
MVSDLEGEGNEVKKTFVSNPVFTYTSVCCGKQAHKEPCQRSKEDRKENKMSQSPLGTWRCGQCEQKTKVIRSKFKEATNVAQTQTTV